MRKSASVPASLVIAVASGLLATGCAQPRRDVRYCVDQYNRVLTEYQCEQYYARYGPSYGGYYGSYHPHWVYHSIANYAIGSVLSGYRPYPYSGASIFSRGGGAINYPSSQPRYGGSGAPGGGGGFGRTAPSGRASGSVESGGFGGKGASMGGWGGS